MSSDLLQHLHYKIHYICLTFQVEHRSLTLGEVLDGDRMAKALYDVKFKSKWHKQYNYIFENYLIFLPCYVLLNEILFH